MDFQLPILPGEQFFLIESGIDTVRGQAVVEGLDSLTVRVGVREEDFEVAFGFGPRYVPTTIITKMAYFLG
jgi:hypothetical protein